MVLKDKTVILDTNDLMTYLAEKLGDEIIEALEQLYDATITDAYIEIEEELRGVETLLEERDMEISALEQQLYELEKEFDKLSEGET